MRKLRPWIVLMVVLSGVVLLRGRASCAEDKTVSVAAAAAPATTAPATTAAVTSPELAWRYASLAQDALHTKEITPAHFKESAALLMAAMKLDPDEPRYARLLYEAMLQLHDNEGALKALKAFRSISIAGRPDFEQPVNDELMMVNYIDLVAGTKETAEQKLDFYKGILQTAAPDSVKSHAAFKASRIAYERGQNDLEDSLIGQSLKFNPLNLNALRVKLEQLSVDGTGLERVNVLQTMIKSNPSQPHVLYRLARELADAGLAEHSLRFYTMSANLSGALGVAMGREFALGYASELYMMGQAQLLVPAKEILKNLLAQDSGDVESLMVLWFSQRAGGDAEKENAAKTQQQVLNAALNRLMTIRQSIVGPTNATTRPVETPGAIPIPDVAGDIEKLKDEKFEAIRLPYTQALADLAWYMVFVGGQADQAEKLLPTLKALLSDKHPIVVRIEGWIFLQNGKLQPAGVKLKAVSDQDMIAQAGTLLLWAKNPSEKPAAIEAARKLMLQHNSGLQGAILIHVLNELGVKIVQRDDAEAIKKSIEDFPKAWFAIITAPQTMYTMRGEMLNGRVGFQFGEPMIARVTIKNISQFDLTIGPEGVIHNDLWFDIQLRGLVPKVIQGAAFERLSQALVLKPGAVMTQTVRLDQGQLAEAFAIYPNFSMTFYTHVRTNPVAGGSLPGGYDVTFSSINERTGFAVNQNTIQAMVAQISSGTPVERMRNLDLMGAEIEQLRDPKRELDERGKVILAAMMEILNKTTDDPTPAVSTWGMFLTAFHNPNKRVDAMNRLAGDPDPARKLLSFYIAERMASQLVAEAASNPVVAKQSQEAKRILKKAADEDKDEMVKLFVSGAMELVTRANANPTTMPTGGLPGPTTAPTTAPTPLIPPATTPTPETPKQP